MTAPIQQCLCLINQSVFDHAGHIKSSRPICPVLFNDERIVIDVTAMPESRYSFERLKRQ